MGTGSPVNDYQVLATLTVAAADEAAARTALTDALAAINGALADLASEVSFSLAEDPDPPGAVAMWSAGHGYAAEGGVLVRSTSTMAAQALVESAQTAIDGAIVETSPQVRVTLEKQEGRYVFQQL